jgi:hypothetical protein
MPCLQRHQHGRSLPALRGGRGAIADNPRIMGGTIGRAKTAGELSPIASPRRLAVGLGVLLCASPMLAASQVLLPIEVMGADGTIARATFPVAPSDAGRFGAFGCGFMGWRRRTWRAFG